MANQENSKKSKTSSKKETSEKGSKPKPISKGKTSGIVIKPSKA
jgi:hypothetical protein